MLPIAMIGNSTRPVRGLQIKLHLLPVRQEEWCMSAPGPSRRLP